MMAMEFFAAPGREDSVEEMLETFVPDYDSLGDDSVDGVEAEVEQGVEEAKEMADKNDPGIFDFAMKHRESITLPDMLWWPNNMHHMAAGHLAEILPPMPEPRTPSNRPTAAGVASKFVAVFAEIQEQSIE